MGRFFLDANFFRKKETSKIGFDALERSLGRQSDFNRFVGSHFMAGFITATVTNHFK